MTDRRKLLGEHLREVRYAAGYTGRPAFAEAAGIAERSVSSVELGAGGRKSRSAMARVLGIDPTAVEDYVTGRTDELPQPVTNPHANTPVPIDPVAKIITATEGELDEFQRIFAKYRGTEEGERFRAWAEGVRTGHSVEPDSVPPRPREREPQ